MDHHHPRNSCHVTFIVIWLAALVNVLMLAQVHLSEGVPTTGNSVQTVSIRHDNGEGGLHENEVEENMGGKEDKEDGIVMEMETKSKITFSTMKGANLTMYRSKHTSPPLVTRMMMMMMGDPKTDRKKFKGETKLGDWYTCYEMCCAGCARSPIPPAAKAACYAACIPLCYEK